MLATHGPASPSSAVILENWRRCADAVAGRPSVPASARTRAVRRQARAYMLEVPDANMTRGGWRRAREGPGPAVVADRGPWEGASFVQSSYKWGTRITIESAGGYGGGRRSAARFARPRLTSVARSPPYGMT